MSRLFDNISEKNKEKIYKILKTTTNNYPKDINILSNVNRPNFIGIIEEGTAQLVFNDYLGNKTILETLKEEDIFGSLITNINSDEITCITKEKTRVTYIDYDRITDTENIKYDYYLTFIKNLLIILEEQLTSKNERIAILTKKTTRDKLLQYFKLTSIKKGSRTFTIPYSFTELAGYLSVDRSAMTREMDEGFIKIDKKRITIDYM